MLTADEIRAALRRVPDDAAIAILAALADARPWEAIRIAVGHLGGATGSELVASLIRAQVTT